MARMIDAEALAEAMGVKTLMQTEWTPATAWGVPIVDAVEVVRCKDCIHNQLPPTSGNADCELWYGMTDLYGFCHYGERRKDASKTD